VRKFIVIILAFVAVFWIVDPFGDGLPEATDEDWVAEQAEMVADKRLTTGRFLSTSHDDVVEVTSGWEPISDRVADLLRNSPDFPDFPSKAKPNVAGDVETKAAMMMREAEADIGVVVINHPQICNQSMGCTVAVPAILQEGSTLYVWERDSDKPVVLTGKASE
jgi:hypothetical protein